MNDVPPLLLAEGVSRTYGRRRIVHAVRDVDVSVRAGRSLGIAGESGSGKSTLLRLLLDLERPDAGSVHFEGVDLAGADRATMRRFRQSVQAVFQDPGSSFNPRMRLWRSLTEPAWVVHGHDRDAQRDLAGELLRSVDLPVDFRDKYPHQLSGGERQRAAVARALSSQPRLVVLDEPVTALDVSIRGSVLNLLAERAAALGVTYVVVSHDLSAIYHLTQELSIMYRGRVVEQGPTADVIADPQHPYTQMLVASVGDPLYAPPGDHDTLPPLDACPYLLRCPYAYERCGSLPPLYATADDRTARCHLHDPDDPPTTPGRAAEVDRSTPHRPGDVEVTPGDRPHTGRSAVRR
jgi:oligopeptide/dipeptide ABC transporter ATP-binding protein